MPPPGVCLEIMEVRHRQDSHGSVTSPKNFFNQDYQHLKQYCLIKGVRYIDEMFPPDHSSIGQGLLSPSDQARVEWLRPAKISPNPAFVLDGVSRFDFGQGVLGDCWFLASIGALTFQIDVLKQVVPLEQRFDDNYCGLFHFRFWRFGSWVDVVIDDKLPTLNGRLIFVQSKDQNEFWPALLEKAYAKVCGSYKDMTAGIPSEAMMDFTGGVHICIKLSQPPPDLWGLLCRAGKANALIGCGTPQGETPSNVLPNGLVQGHAYTVTGVKEMMSQGKLYKLIRLWNPWGKGEWNGDWSDNSPLWQTVSFQDREKCHTVCNNGEFWMTLEDFCKFYEDLDICSPSPDFLDTNSCSKWKTEMYFGRWVAGTTAGGCLNNKDSFWTNPQFRVKSYSEKEGEMLVSLMQKPDKRNRHLVQNLHIGFSVFEMTEQYKAQVGKFPASFFNTNAPVAQTKTYLNARDVTELLTLKPGEYLIVPSTFNPYETASFILTIHSKEETLCYENSGDHKYEPVEVPQKVRNAEHDESKRGVFRQYSDKYEEVDAEQLQKLLNDNILKGDLKSGGFSIDACRSMVALMDLSITGKLNSLEFIRLWNKVVTYKDIFFLTDVSRTGMLSLSELRNALVAAGMRVGDDMLNLMALRYGASAGHMTLESFISLIIRLDCMQKIFKQMSDGKAMHLKESEWMYFSMYT
ncbi:calpain-2 catalytic subunit-like [Mugil cephalus]|uniref:calpain-2 catalytic subunit-like n=1 Tax=Mugil cephalus TaxID=48193 RepID=UPI001FB6D07F|nr:calpain-2 catalytic subunit-like [Mugil cephalus]XP_047467979.1 calpain-2 catalytic subunit-like [Mugil cephalus]XP_047467980.1 calpain-2 catalytic subunit-like [Mugil cephalus]